MRTETLP